MMTGIEEASKVTNVCTFINIATLAALIILSLFNIDFSNWTYVRGRAKNHDLEYQLLFVFYF